MVAHIENVKDVAARMRAMVAILERSALTPPGSLDPFKTICDGIQPVRGVPSTPSCPDRLVL